MLMGESNIEIHHEYLCTHIQKVACLYFMGLLSKAQAKFHIQELHGAAIYYSPMKYWADCSNKLSWLIEPLYELFPLARFIHIVRDGRKVASSYFHKLSDEMYDDESVNILSGWLANPDKYPIPPPEKKYWWNIPQPGQPFYDEFQMFDQFERACYQWREANRVIVESLSAIPEGQKLTIKLEDLTSDREQLGKLLAFFELPYEERFYEYLQTPQNVIFPLDFRLTDHQLRQFFKIAGDMMDYFGYTNQEEYTVFYGPDKPSM
jgi:hypothetical protein